MRFNEAPIHESGKSVSRPAGSVPGFRFNEAPIHESGKSDRCELLGDGELVASMRPRFMNRGSFVESVPAERVEAASMRPRFMNRGSRSIKIFGPRTG